MEIFDTPFARRTVTSSHNYHQYQLHHHWHKSPFLALGCGGLSKNFTQKSALNIFSPISDTEFSKTFHIIPTYREIAYLLSQFSSHLFVFRIDSVISVRLFSLGISYMCFFTRQGSRTHTQRFFQRGKINLIFKIICSLYS